MCAERRSKHKIEKKRNFFAKILVNCKKIMYNKRVCIPAADFSEGSKGKGYPTDSTADDSLQGNV